MESAVTHPSTRTATSEAKSAPGAWYRQTDWKRFYAGWWLAFVISTSGCARWSQLEHEPKPVEKNLLSRPVSDDVAQVEVIFLRIGAEQAEALETIWPRINEQALSIELRERLDSNGIRAGVVDSGIPLTLQSMIDAVERRLKDDPLEQIGIGADIPSHARLLQCKKDQRKELFLGSRRTQSLNIFHNEDGIARGRTYEQPQLLLDLRAKPDGHGGTHVLIVPEIQHGELKQKFVANQEFAFKRELRRDAEQWNDLAIEKTLQAGQLLLISAAPPPRGLGADFFFTETSAGMREQLLMIVRAGPSQLDSVFAKH